MTITYTKTKAETATAQTSTAVTVLAKFLPTLTELPVMTVRLEPMLLAEKVEKVAEIPVIGLIRAITPGAEFLRLQECSSRLWKSSGLLLQSYISSSASLQ